MSNVTVLDTINGRGVHDFNPTSDTRSRYLGVRHKAYQVNSSIPSAHGLVSLSEYGRDKVCMFVVLGAEFAGAVAIANAHGLALVYAIPIWGLSLLLDAIVLWRLSVNRGRADVLHALKCKSLLQIYRAEAENDPNKVHAFKATLSIREHKLGSTRLAIAVWDIMLFIMALTKIAIYLYGIYDLGAPMFSGTTVVMGVIYFGIAILHAFYASWFWNGWRLVRAMDSEHASYVAQKAAAASKTAAASNVNTVLWEGSIEIQLPASPQLAVLPNNVPCALVESQPSDKRLTISGLLADEHVYHIINKQTQEEAKSVAWCSCVAAQADWLGVRDE